MRPTLRHRIEHTENKHSRAVCQGNTIVIRLARNLSKIEERDHIQSLLRRMTHLVLQEQQKTIINPFRHLLAGGQTLTVRLGSGRRYMFTLQPGARTKAVRTHDGWNIEVSPQIRRASLHRFLWSLLARAEHARMTGLVHEINAERFGHNIRRVKLGFATTQWGSCSPRRVIMINAALLFVPPSLLRYVIVHELAHLRIADHSPRYWEEVKRALPNYKIAYNELHNYRLPQL